MCKPYRFLLLLFFFFFLQPDEIITNIPDLITHGGEFNNKLSKLQWFVQIGLITVLIAPIATHIVGTIVRFVVVVVFYVLSFSESNNSMIFFSY